MINRLLFISVMMLGFMMSVEAQPYLSVGTNISSIYDSNLNLEQEYNSNPVFSFGRALLEKSKLSANLELQYSVKGFKIKGAVLNDEIFIPQANSNLRIHYLDFMPTIDFPIHKQMNLVLGGNGAVKLLDTYNDIRLESFKMKPHRSVDYGWVIGTKISYKQYWLRALVNKGLMNISDSDGSDHYKNVNVQVVLGFSLDKNS